MRRNLRKQQRAIELLNKKSVVYAYYTNFLRFCYKKYKAKNSRILENNLNALDNYLYLADRIDTVRSLMYETEAGIERFLRENKLSKVRTTIEDFAENIRLDDKKRRYDNLKTEKESMENALTRLDARHQEIWVILSQLENGESGDSVLPIIEAYLSEAGKLLEANEKKNESRVNP
jgi:hypothetical protein